MPYVIGLIVLALLLTYPIGRWQRRRLLQHPEQVATGDGIDTSTAPGDANPISAEAILRQGGAGGGYGPR